MGKSKKIEEIIQTFDENIELGHKQISDTVKKITDTDKSVCCLIEEFKNNMNKLTILASNIFEKELDKLLKQYQENCAKWCEAVNSMIEGKEFVNQFEKSVLVVVFGNVNVGKSTVGNMIAGVNDPASQSSHERDGDILKQYFGEAPEFFEYDFAQDNNREKNAKKKADKFFKEGYIETTANIQYFTRKKGLTWTDSPGICSVNWKNGDLAKKYVEFADLVIFITTSSSPGKDDELQELRKLFNKKKPVLILVNKSDRNDIDEVDGKIVNTLLPKSDEDRKKQEKYIQDHFRDIVGDILLNTDAVSISTYLAMTALREDDIEKFEQSGFPKFYEKLGKIFEKNAVELKMNAPKQRVNAMIDEIVSGGTVGAQTVMGICQYRKLLSETQNNAEKIKKEIKNVSENAIPAIRKCCIEKITSVVHEYVYKIRKNGSMVDLQDQVNKIVTETVAEVLEKYLREVLEDYNSKMADGLVYKEAREFKLNVKKETIERYEYDIREVNRDPDGIIEYVEKFIFKKQFTRSEVRKRKVVDTFVNGDNSTEVLEQISQEIGLTIERYVEEFVQIIQNQYFEQEKNFVNKILEMLDTLEEKLKGEKLENDTNDD